MKNKQYHTVGTILKSNIKIVERAKTNTPNTPCTGTPFHFIT